MARNPGGQARRRPSRFLDGLRPASTTDRPVTGGSGRSRRKDRRAALCKLCQKPLGSSRERNRGYCEDCPIPYDEELFESLKVWRKERAAAESVPAYVVFSDATLEALAEVRPSGKQALLRVNGIGQAKLEKYADDLLEILAGDSAEKPR